jgi:MFS family permease
VIFNLPRWHCGLWILITLFFCIGVPAGAGYPPLMTLFQRAAPDSLRGRMFAVTGAAQAAASILGAGIAGALGDHVGVMDLLTVQGAGYVAAAITLRIMIGQGPRRMHDPVGCPAVRERTRAPNPGPLS